jgi:putative membrane protein
MTSSDAPPPAPPTAPAPTLAAGHLHPALLFLRLLDGLRQAVLPAALGLLTQQAWLLAISGVVFVMTLGVAIVRYVTFRYRLTPDELITTEGILHRQERRIPVNRVQDLSFESTLLRRILGLVVVSVETASGQGAEARLDSLARRDADWLRAMLLRARGERTAQAQEQRELLLYRSTPGELSLLGLTNNRVGAILISLVGLGELASDFGFGGRLTGLLSGIVARLSALHWTLVAAVIGGLLFTALIGGWLIAVAGSFLMFSGFTLTLRGDVLQRRYGLLTTRAQSLPRRKVQRVLVEQTWLRRLFGLAILRADSAGSAMDPREEARGGLDVIAPLTTVAQADTLVPVLLPGLEPRALRWQRVSPRVVARVLLMGGVSSVALAVPAWLRLGPFGLVFLLGLPLSLTVGLLLYSNLAYARAEGHVAMRFGIAGRYRSLIPLRKVQAVILQAGPIERLFGLASLTVYVAGGSPTRLKDLPRDEAQGLLADLASHAASARFVW